VVIDEVQKLPVLLEVVHLLIEAKQGVQFIFTGSSARKQLFELPDDLATKVTVVYYADAKDALLKALSE